MISSVSWLLWLCLSFAVATGPAQQPLQDEDKSPDSVSRPYRIAIIGAGAGGSSAAYHLDQFARSGSPVDITIFDTNSRVGGRTTTVNALDDPRYPTEVGASIFVKVNHILYNASQEFGLASKSYSSTRDKATGSLYDLGIWDGNDIVFTTTADADDDQPNNRWRWKLGGWWDIARLLYRYGLSPIKTQRLTKYTIGQFLKFYDDPVFPFSSLDEAVNKTGLADVLSVTGDQTLLNAGVSESFAREIVQASTRVNYAQNLDTIHGLETLVCMATDGAMSIDGGNWQIFDEFVRRSGAHVHLDTAVTNINKTDKGTWVIRTNTRKEQNSQTEGNNNNEEEQHQEFDAVVLAAPYQFANITIHPSLSPSHTPQKLDYVTLHVTLFTTPLRPSQAFFNLTGQDQSHVPDSILTTVPQGTRTGRSRGVDAIGENVKFWSLSTLRVIQQSPAEQTQYLYKIFSPEKISPEFLRGLFGVDGTSTLVHDADADGNGNEYQQGQEVGGNEDQGEKSIKDLEFVSWSYTHVWRSYPYLPPIDFSRADSHEPATFTPIMLDTNFYYTSGMESFISTMETSALMGMNVARLIMDGLVTAT